MPNFTNYNDIQTFLQYLRDKHTAWNDQDFQGLSLCHRQNVGYGLLVQLFKELEITKKDNEDINHIIKPFSLSKKDIYDIAHSACKIITLYNLLLYAHADGLMTFPGFLMYYFKQKKINWEGGKFNPGFMDIDPIDIVKEYTIDGDPIYYHEVDSYDDFLVSDIFYGHVRIKEKDYNHSMNFYNLEGDIDLADVSYRTQGAKITDYVNKDNFLYYSYLRG
jgi:hypothetical protein